MTVDVVAEECRAFLCDHAETAVWKETRLDKCLESVADTEDKSAAVEQCVDSICYLLVVQHICNELTATVRLITRRESAAYHKDMTLVDILLHLSDRTEDVIFGKVAEHAHTHLGAGISPCLCRVIVAVGSRKHRQICDWGLNRLALIFKVCAFCLIWLDVLHASRNKFLVICLGGVRIYLRELGSIGSNEFEYIELHTVDGELAILSVCHLTDENCIRIVKSILRLNKDRAVAIVEEFLLVHLDLRIKSVSE